MLIKNYYDKVEEPNFLKHIIYGDTDSLFINIPIKNPEKLTIQEKLTISDKISNDINDHILKYLNEYFLPKSNISTIHNSTYFKTEMLIGSIIFLDVKKTYAYKLLALKGQILNEPSIEYTGMQVIRSDASKLTQDLLREIIEKIILNEKISLKEKLQYTINTVNNTHQKYINSINELDLVEISIPGKWSKADQIVNGMLLYNFIMKKEIFSGGSSGYFIYCTFKNIKLFQNSKLDMSKIKGIVIPRFYDKLLLKKVFDDFQIQIDKQQQWDTLYSTTIDRVVNLVKSLK